MGQESSGVKASKAHENVRRKDADGFMIVDREGMVCFVDPALEDVFARESRSLVGTKFGFLLSPGKWCELNILRPGGSTGLAQMRAEETEWRGEMATLVSVRNVADSRLRNE